MTLTSTSTSRARAIARRMATAVASAAIVATAIAGCGGSQSATTGAGTTAAGAPAEQTATGVGEGARQGSSSAARRPARAHTEAAATVSAAAKIRPCRLVAAAEASRTLGQPLAKVFEATQGPTCIYQPKGAGRIVTLTVEPVSFASIRPHARTLGRQKIGKSTAYCVRYGQVMTFVPIAPGRVLNVVGPCAVGRRFAAIALPRIKT